MLRVAFAISQEASDDPDSVLLEAARVDHSGSGHGLRPEPVQLGTAFVDALLAAAGDLAAFRLPFETRRRAGTDSRSVKRRP